MVSQWSDGFLPVRKHLGGYLSGQMPISAVNSLEH
jgi:hypothetical protein